MVLAAFRTLALQLGRAVGSLGLQATTDSIRLLGPRGEVIVAGKEGFARRRSVGGHAHDRTRGGDVNNDEELTRTESGEERRG